MYKKIVELGEMGDIPSLGLEACHNNYTCTYDVMGYDHFSDVTVSIFRSRNGSEDWSLRQQLLFHQRNIHGKFYGNNKMAAKIHKNPPKKPIFQDAILKKLLAKMTFWKGHKDQITIR